MPVRNFGKKLVLFWATEKNKILTVYRIKIVKFLSEICLFCISENITFFCTTFVPHLGNAYMYVRIFFQNFWSNVDMFFKKFK